MSTLNQCYSSCDPAADARNPFRLFDFASHRDDLPISHVWDPVEDRHSPAHPVAPLEEECRVPVIDLSKPTEALLPEVARACESWGVFGVVGHGVPADLLGRVESECRRLFALPADRKLGALRPPSGLSGFGSFVIGRHFSKAMWSESFTMAGSLREDARGAWTEHEEEDYQRFCDVFEEYKEVVKKAAVRLSNLIFASLGSSPDDAGWAGGDSALESANPVLQANWYPSCPDPARAMGLAPHTDSSLLTFVFQTNTAGFQVLLPAADSGDPARWVPVPAVDPGMLVVNLGDFFRILSNGRYQSALHRVVAAERERYSVSFFLGPPTGTKVKPLMRVLEERGEAPAFREVSWGEFVALKLKHMDRVLEEISCVDDKKRE